MVCGALALCCTSCFSRTVNTEPSSPRVPAANGPLRSVEELGSLTGAEKSRAAFAEASKVLLHPRCLNCHPPDDHPRQRDDHQLHDPPVFRGPDDRGLPGLRCDGCHQATNLELARVPGAPMWHLAPVEMAWLGKSAFELCQQLKDPKRNGGKSLAEIVEHTAHDPLVAWGWNPGHGREPAPGTQERFGKLMAAWADNGAVCVKEQP